MFELWAYLAFAGGALVLIGTVIDRRQRRSARYDHAPTWAPPTEAPTSRCRHSTLEAPPARFDLLNNEPGEALTRRAISETGITLGTTSWHKGAAGESFTSDHLEPLRTEGWFIFDSIPLAKGGDIDHLAIGPPGVFVINSKNYANARVNADDKTLLINATPRGDLLEEAKRDAAIACEVIEMHAGLIVPVTAALAFINASSIKGYLQVGGVLIAESRHIAQILENSGQEELTEDEVIRLGNTLRDSRVWSS
ncbi:nuclease-related domain-containing protein [Streptomyces inhibens]|uniref:nuclease-related domain-containing protein n=1 Tax=Streptomyces inhibens TaxID=2293571 RepID=UPI00402AD0E7